MCMRLFLKQDQKYPETKHSEKNIFTILGSLLHMNFSNESFVF